jgi:glycosyltransferase involved in cell wall biosynthesis
MYLHLKKSPYKKAAEYAHDKAGSLLKKNKSTQPLISVIIPCYNQGIFLNDAVNSVLQQTYENFEIIIINDGSTDEYTNSLLKKYKKPKTTVYETKNQGVTLTRNYGVTLAKGDLIQFLDADDYIDKQKFEYQANLFMADRKVDVCYTSYEYYFVSEKQHKPPFHGLVLGDDPFDDFLYRWQRGLSIPIHSAMFRKKLFEKSPPFISGMKGSEDWIMWVDIASRGAKFAFINEPLATYRVQEKSITLNGEHMFYWACRAVAYIADKYINPAGADRYDTVQQHYLKYLADYLLYSDTHKTDTNNSSKYRAMAKNTLPYKAARMLYRKGPSATIRATIRKIGGK